MPYLKDRVDEVTLLFYRWPQKDPKSQWGYTYHWECDYCQTRFYGTQSIVNHALVDHFAKRITLVVVEE